MLPFDKDGTCTGPLTRDDLLAAVKPGKFTDIILFSHGWNNTWFDAVKLYEGFIVGYTEMLKNHGLAYPREVRPLLVGISWPSIALVMPWEAGPQIAGDPDDTRQADAAADTEWRALQELAAGIVSEQRARFYALAQSQTLDADETRELADLLAPLYAGDHNDLSGGEPPTADELVALWKKIAPANTGGSDDDTGDFGFVDDSGDFGTIDDADADPQAAGWADFLDPRVIIRGATVYQMKDRAGIVGTAGVGPVLRELLARSGDARVHLIGHSYGCKVMLSALCAAPLSRKVNSVLLLQPAISYLCFAPEAGGTDMPGGYRSALSRIQQPILTTYSDQDGPLHDFFHLVVRRPSDLGEQQIAGVPPSLYAALGGYGPADNAPETDGTSLKQPGEAYQLGGGAARVIGLDGTGIIQNHGDISNEATWWALYQQLSA
jgi:hypothetical protein